MFSGAHTELSQAQGSSGARIVLIPKGYLGDLVLTTPVLEALKTSDPSLSITMLVPPQFEELVRRDPFVDDVIVFDRRAVGRGWKGVRAFAEVLRSKRFDAAYSFHRSLRTSLLLWRAGIPRRVGYADSHLACLYTDRVEKTMRCHEVVRNLELVLDRLEGEVQQEVLALKKGGPAPVSSRFSLRLPPSNPEDLSVIVTTFIAHEVPYVVLAPGSAWATKRWRPDGFREVAQGLQARGLRVVVVGSSGDLDACNAVCRGVGDSTVNLCGRTNFAELVHLIRGARAVVCNDSVALHIASAHQVPTVAIFCATSPLFGFGPWKNRAIVVEKGELFCKPCRRHGSRRCPTGTEACMKGVTSQMVLQAYSDLSSEDLRHRGGGSLRVIES
jgi:heptosyltransferase-2